MGSEGYLVEAQVVLDGVGGVEDGPVGAEDQDKAIESLERREDKHNNSTVIVIRWNAWIAILTSIHLNTLMHL